MKKTNFTLRTTMALLGATAMIGIAGQALANDEIIANNKDQNLWGSPGGDYALTRHSGLKDINTKTVGKLHMAWEQSTGALRGHEGQPVVVNHNGKPMMYFVSAWPNIVQALDLSDPDNPKQVWNYNKKTDRDMSAVPRACCDTINRGLNYADGKVVFHTLDGLLIALDATTGEEVWITKHAFPEKGETHTGPAMIAGGLIFAGFGGDEFAARGRTVAYDLQTGKEVWKCHSTGSDKDVCLTPETNKDNPHYGTYGHDLGMITYPNDEWKIGGGAPWAWYSYDPDLDIVYMGTGNPGHWSPAYRCGETGKNLTHEKCNAYNPKINSGNWDNKWSMTIMARKAKTGEMVWAYQKTPFDQWDYDGVNENILVDMKIDGKMRKSLVNFDRNGFAYVMDRENGDLLRAHKFVTVDWATKVDLVTGRPLKVKEHSPFERGRNVASCPSAQGGKDQQPGAVDPNDPEWFYMPTNNWCMEDEPQERTHTQQGTVYVFANVYMYQEKPGVSGKLKKFNVVTGKTAWEIADPYQNWSGVLVTSGGLAFYGNMEGQFRAVDRNSGKVLWNKKLGSGIIGNPISWKIAGKQYVGIFSGIGGWAGLPVTADLDFSDKYGAIGATAMAKTVGLNLIPQGGLFTAFRVYE